MPGLDKTGPMGQGARSGRGQGSCQENGESLQMNPATGLGLGRGRGGNRGAGRGRSGNRGLGGGLRMQQRVAFAESGKLLEPSDERSYLETRKTLLQNQLKQIDRKLGSPGSTKDEAR